METQRAVERNVISCIFFILAIVILFNTPPATANVMTMTFEEFLGQDGTQIGTFYPGIRFEALTSGNDWLVSDVTTGNYNASSWPTGQSWGHGNYWIYDYAGAWTGTPGSGGKIAFDNTGTIFVEVGYCCATTLMLTAYDLNNNVIDSDSGPANRRYEENNSSGPGTLRVDAPSGNFINYVTIHDTGNYWIVDNITIGTALDFSKISDVPAGQCRTLDEEITYTISWNYTGESTFENVYVIDTLPAGVTFLYEIIDEQPAEDPNWFDPNMIWEYINDPNFVWPDPLPAGIQGVYDRQAHTIIWPLDTISQGSSGSVSFKVQVNEKSVPGGILHNIAEIWSGEMLLEQDTEDTLVCCWGDDPSLIYVDICAPDGGNGTSWARAYNNLQDAMARARTSQCSESYTIYCAQGTYTPDETPEEGFILPDNVSVYGGFKTGGCDFADRNPKKYQTILTGLIDEDEFPDARIVVTMGAGTLLDGFTINSAFDSCVYGNNANFTVSHCIIKDSYGYGIYAVNCNVAVQWCKINTNGTTGLYHEGEGFTLSVDNSWIMRNGEYGVYTVDSTLEIKNSIISESDMMEQGRQGIRIVNPTYQPKIYNATIANNKAAGVFFKDNGNITGDPNNLDYPDLQNSIVFYNNRGGPQLIGLNADLHANFCCIQDCNEPGTTNFNAEPGFAYAVDPNGTPDPNNYHLSADSVCIDRANPDPAMGYELQVDFDNELRQYGNGVDVGADEVYDCHDDYLSQADVYNALDFDADGLVNLNEFRLFSAAWLTYDPNHPYCDPNNPYYVDDPNAPGYIDLNDKLRFNPLCDLDDDLHVGLSDIIIFSQDWLWIACWKLEEITASMMSTQSQAQFQSLILEPMMAQSSLSVSAVQVQALEPVLDPSVMVEESVIEQEQEEVSAETLIELIRLLDEILLTETDNIEGIEQIKAILQEELNTLLAAQEQ